MYNNNNNRTCFTQTAADALEVDVGVDEHTSSYTKRRYKSFFLLLLLERMRKVVAKCVMHFLFPVSVIFRSKTLLHQQVELHLR